MQHSSFTDIGQFRDVIRSVKQKAQFVGLDETGEAIINTDAEMPVIKFHGTCKTHGTNASLAIDKDDNIWFQGRNRNVTIEQDNAGFAFFAEARKEVFKDMLLDIRQKQNLTDDTIILFGEFCGRGIQKGVAINELPKMFIIFAVKIVNEDTKENYYLKPEAYNQYMSPENLIFNVHDFQSFDIDIDFNDPTEAQNKLVELTLQVEKECPIGKAFGVSGVGEGIVYEGFWEDSRYVFKVKGEKHSSSASRTKTLAPVDIEKVNSIKEFIEYAVTENRLNQAIEQVFTSRSLEPDRKMTGEFLKWIVNDVHKEEMDTMVGNGLEPKDVNGKLSEKARNWFFNYIDSIV